MERFMKLYEPIYKDLYRLAYYYLGNPQDAEDVVGETVLRAYEKFSSLRKEEAFKSWIFRILVNQCKSHLHKRPTGDVSGLITEPSYHPKLEDTMVTKDMLSILSQEERQIVALAVFGGYKGEEIADMLHLKHNTVRSKYRRALKKLEHHIVAEKIK